MKKKLLILDLYNLIHRAYHALPKTFADKEGNPTNAIYGVSSMLISIFEAVKPDFAMAAVDGQKPTFRSVEFTAYKAHRKETEQDLGAQIPKILEIIDAFGIKRILVDGYEADDIIGTEAIKHSNDSCEIVIVSNDRDLWQLVRNNIFILVPASSAAGKTEWLGIKEVEARMGFSPEKIIDYKGLRGDPSDNIPGVFGIGEKTAKKLIMQFGTIEEIYKHINEIEPESLRKKLIECTETAFLSKKLATIITDVPITTDLVEYTFSGLNKGTIKEALEKYNFRSLLKRLGFTYTDTGDLISKGAPPENQLQLL